MVEILKQNSVIIPLLAAVIASILGYLWGQRTKRFDQFYIQSSESLKDACSPIFHELKQIINSKHSEKFEPLLEKFFDKYNSSDSKIYKLGKIDIIDDFYILTEAYESWKVFPTDNRRNILCNSVDRFYYLVKKEYYGTIKSVYSDYKWVGFIYRKNYLMRILLEALKLLQDTLFFALIICLLFWYFTFCLSHFLTNNTYMQNISALYSIAVSLLYLSSISFIAALITLHGLCWILGNESSYDMFYREYVKKFRKILSSIFRRNRRKQYTNIINDKGRKK